MRHTLVLAAASIVMSAALVACGGDTPAVCESADQVESSLADLKDIDVTEENGLDEFKSELETVDGNLAQFTSDAKSEFAPQVDAVEASFEALKTSVGGSTDDITPDTLAASKTALDAFSTALQTLISDVKATC